MAGVKSYSIIIVPSDHSGTRQYRISRAMLYVLLLIAVIVVITLGIFAFTYTSILMDARHVSDVEAENETLRVQVDRVEDLSRELEALSGLRAQVVQLLGNDVLDDNPAIEQIGERIDHQGLTSVDMERLRQLFADSSRQPFAPRAWPADGRVRREFLAAASSDESAHPGIAIAARSPEIRASGRGRVLRADFASQRNHIVILEHGYGFRTIYGNLDRVDVTVGQTVERGQAIGRIEPVGESMDGEDRASTMLNGALYFELRVDGTPVDPRGHLEPR